MILTKDAPVDQPVNGDPSAPVQASSPAVPAWMAGLNIGERRRIELGRLLAKSDNAIRALVVDDDAYLLLAKLAGMLDVQG